MQLIRRAGDRQSDAPDGAGIPTTDPDGAGIPTTDPNGAGIPTTDPDGAGIQFRFRAEIAFQRYWPRPRHCHNSSKAAVHERRVRLHFLDEG